MKTDEINIRDPYILCDNGIYYLYGTRAETCWGKAEGFDCYKSKNLIDWSEPVEIFKGGVLCQVLEVVDNGRTKNTVC